MREKSNSSIKFTLQPDSFVYRDSIIGTVGRRAGALFFARHLDYFVVTRYSQPLPGLGTVTQLHRDPWLRSHLPGLAKNSSPRRRQPAPNDQ
jgi:hypothetical protein